MKQVKRVLQAIHKELKLWATAAPDEVKFNPKKIKN